jgi:hypothetical protein
MALSGTTSTGFLKDVWLPAYINQYENAPGTLLSLFRKDSADKLVEGANTYFKVRIGDSLGQETITEGGDYPEAGDVSTAQATVTAAHLAHTIELTSEEAVYYDSGSAAAAPIIQTKMDAAMDTMSRDIERQSWMDGTGVLANVASSSGATITLDATTTAQIDRDRYIWIDDGNRRRYMVVHGTTGATQEDNFTVSSIAESTNVLTCSSADMTSATSAGVVVHRGNWATGGAFRSLEFAGLSAMLDDDNTYLGINRATAANAYWKAIVDTNSGTLRDLTETLILQFLSKMARRRSDGKQPRGDDYIALASPGSWNAYHSLLLPAQRYTNATPELGWGDPLPMRGIMLYQDIHCPRNGIMVVHKPSVKYVKAKYAGNLNGDLLKFLNGPSGDIWFQKTGSVAGRYAAARQAMLEGFIGMMTMRPRNHGWLRDITEVGSAY